MPAQVVLNVTLPATGRVIINVNISESGVLAYVVDEEPSPPTPTMPSQSAVPPRPASPTLIWPYVSARARSVYVDEREDTSEAKECTIDGGEAPLDTDREVLKHNLDLLERARRGDEKPIVVDLNLKVRSEDTHFVRVASKEACGRFAGHAGLYRSPTAAMQLFRSSGV